MKVISFCIYGSTDKYCKGLDENLKLIQTNLPDYNVFIYLGDNVPENWINQYQTYTFVRIIKTYTIGMYNRCKRFLAIDEPDVELMVVRDTDSRLHDRDIWCIKQWEYSNYSCHIIRDHPEHRALILAGLWAIKKSNLNMESLLKQYLNINSDINYVQYDQYFLRDIIYPLFCNNAIIYVFNERMKMKGTEYIYKIPFDVTNDDFCGLAIKYDETGQEIKEYKWNYGYECDRCKRFCGDTKCGKCKSVTYCTRECQVASWPTHKLVCKTL